MQIFTWNDILTSLNTGSEIPFFAKGTGISTGSFDGLHKGHRVLIKSLADQCNKADLIPGVVTFTRPLPSLKHSQDYQGDVSTLAQREKLLEELGVKFIIIVDFDESFASMLGADYLNLLVNVCNMKLLAEGIDFRCGYKGATDSQAIRYFGEKNSVKTIFVDPVYYREGSDEEERISSSYIRSMIKKGFLATVEELLERKYQLDLSTPVLQVIPPDGAYHCKNEENEEVRVEVKGNSIKTSIPSKSIFF